MVLHAADVTAKPLMVAEPDTKNRRIDIRKLLHEGQEVIVQVAKDAIDDKGPKLTMSLSVATMHWCHPAVGSARYFSAHRKQAERQSKEILQQLADTDFGLIVRTATEGADGRHWSMH